MNYPKFKKIGSICLIGVGAIFMVSEIYSIQKNYYVQSIGVVLLMLGVFLINTNVKSKTKFGSDQSFEEEE